MIVYNFDFEDEYEEDDEDDINKPIFRIRNMASNIRYPVSGTWHPCVDTCLPRRLVGSKLDLLDRS